MGMHDYREKMTRHRKTAIIGKQPMKAKNSAMTEDKEYPPPVIGNNVKIGDFAIIYNGCVIGDNVLIADFAQIREDVVIGDNTTIGCRVTIENKCSIGKNCKIQAHAYITAMSKIGDNCFVSPCVATSNDNYIGVGEERFNEFKGVTVEDRARIGVNATVLPGKVIGENSVVGGGAVVTKDVDRNKIVKGNPAKPTSGAVCTACFKRIPGDVKDIKECPHCGKGN